MNQIDPGLWDYLTGSNMTSTEWRSKWVAKMIEEDIVNAIEIVADQLGIAVEHIYGVFVDAQLVIGILSIVSLVLVIIVALVSAKPFYKFAKQLYTDDKGEWECYDARFVATLISIVAVLIFAVVCFGCTIILEAALLKILCPEYTAIREILSLVMRE